MTTRPAQDPAAADPGTGPDQPVPFTLTPKAHAVLGARLPPGTASGAVPVRGRMVRQPRPTTGCARPAAAGRGSHDRRTGHPCDGHGPDGPCGATPARLYPAGWRCAAHTPAALAGRPEPGAGRYCPPALCWCGHCPAPGPRRSRAGEGPCGAHLGGCRAAVHGTGLAGVRAGPVQAARWPTARPARRPGRGMTRPGAGA